MRNIIHLVGVLLAYNLFLETAARLSWISFAHWGEVKRSVGLLPTINHPGCFLILRGVRIAIASATPVKY